MNIVVWGYPQNFAFRSSQVLKGISQEPCNFSFEHKDRAERSSQQKNPVINSIKTEIH